MCGKTIAEDETLHLLLAVHPFLCFCSFDYLRSSPISSPIGFNSGRGLSTGYGVQLAGGCVDCRNPRISTKDKDVACIHIRLFFFIIHIIKTRAWNSSNILRFSAILEFHILKFRVYPS